MSISASIHADITFGRIPFDVNFTADALVSDTEVQSFLWKFGDGKTSSDRNPVHTYESYGSHTVTLTVTNVLGETFTALEHEIIKGLSLGFREEVIKQSDRYVVYFINESQIHLPDGYSVDSWEWDFGDGYIVSNDYSPEHSYTSRGSFSVSQTVTILGPEVIEPEERVTLAYTLTKANAVVRDPMVYNTCNRFMCIGWVKKPVFSVSGNPLYPFVTSDIYYKVLDTNDAIKFSIIKDGEDYRLGFMGSKTKLINKNYKIDITDNNWHSLVYTCVDDHGKMMFLVDGIEIAPEDGYGKDGYPHGIAYGETSRPGGGNIWAPYLYESGQGIQLYNWRFKVGLNIPYAWLDSLLSEDKRRLGING